LQVVTHTLVLEGLDCVYRNAFRLVPLALLHLHHTWLSGSCWGV